MKPTLRFSTILDGLLVFVHGRERPRDDEWDVYCEHLVGWSARHDRCLVVSHGGGPTSRQLERLQQAVGSRQPRVALVTPSPLVRGIATKLSWHYRYMRSFAPDDLDAALGFLEVEPADRLAVHTAIAAMTKELRVDEGHQNAS